MPIRFRCTYCNRLLGIATRKAGMDTICPHCGYEITVPVPSQDDPKTERLNLDDVDELMGNSASATVKESAVGAPSAPSPPQADNPPVEAPKPAVPRVSKPPVPPPAKPRSAPPPLPKKASKPANSEERPLFEGDLDEILGETAVPEEPEDPKPPATSGMDAMSLEEPTRHIVLGPGKAVALLFAVVALMAISFAAGYFLAPRG